MPSFLVEGGHRLKGTICPQGAKNEVLQILCAVLLTPDEVTVQNVPDILDVRNLIDMLANLGVKVNNTAPGCWSFKADTIDRSYAESMDFVAKSAGLRGSVMLLGPLLARLGHATVSKPGGDKIGRRRVDTHIKGFQALGATFVLNEERGYFELKADKLKGTYMLLDEASDGIGSNLLTITGVKELHGTSHKVLPDMIEVGSFIGMAAMTQSEITIKDVSYQNLGIIPMSFARLGIQMEQRGDDIFIPAQEHYQIESFIDGSIMTLADAPWPGLTPDLLSVLLVTATQAKGSVLIHQKMFESRLFFVDKLIDMGAQVILCDPHRVVVIGHDRQFPLTARRMSSPDIRAGIALLIAAMSAKGTSRIDNIGQIDRGYQNIDGRLNALGAHITRED